jgi:hypothetical protein
MVISRIEAQGTELFLQSPSPEMEAFWNNYIRISNAHRTLDNIYVNEI